jgi:hypothetical protein
VLGPEAGYWGACLALVQVARLSRSLEAGPSSSSISSSGSSAGSGSSSGSSGASSAGSGRSAVGVWGLVRRVGGGRNGMSGCLVK